MKKPIRLIFMIGKFYLYGFFLQILFINLLHANPSNAQNSLDIKKVVLSLSLEDVPLSKIFSSIQAQTSFSFFYENIIIAKTGSVSIDATDKSMEEVLLLLAREYHLSFKQVNDRISVKEAARLKDTRSIVVEQTITGTVTDANGDPLPGVTVSVPGTSIGTATDLDGRYTLSVPEGSTLVFSFIGFESQRIEVGGRSIIDVTLNEDVSSLEEVVVVGYGTQRKSDLTGSVTTLQGEDVAGRQAIQVSQALQGAMPGVMVTRNNSQPGSTASIRIRGITTIGDSNPLIIVDGVPFNNIDNINPNDIESISVLKDAASASIYGARAAAGVILVTTKRGNVGQQGLVYDYKYGIETPTEMPRNVSVTRYLQMANEQRWNDSGNSDNEYPTFPKDDVDNYISLNAQNPDLYPITDWNNLIFKDYAQRQSHSLSFTTGTKNISTNASFSYDNIDGLYANNNYKRITTRINNDVTIIDEVLSATTDVYFNNSSTKRPSVSDIVWLTRRMPPQYAAEWSDGRVAAGKIGDNPYGRLKYGGDNNYLTNQLGGRVSLNLTPLTGLRFSAVLSPNLNYNKRKIFNKQVPYYNWNDPTVFEGYLDGQVQTSLNETREDNYNVTTQFLANYTTSVGQHDLNILAGYENYYAFYENLGASRNEYELTSFPYLNLGPLEFRDNSGLAYENSYRSYFGRLMYNYANKYYLQTNIRTDGSSRFHADHRWGMFPSFSAGWVLSEESFWDKIPAISFLKLRASWGSLGNERIGNYPYQATIAFNNALFYQGNNIVSTQAAAQTQYAIQNISWEKTESFDFGIDAYLLDDRLSFTGDYYFKTTKDMLLPLEIPDFIGFDNPDQNTGIMETRGWEIEVDYRGKIGEFGYSISTNLSDFKSVMGDLGGTEFIGSQINKEGSEFNEWYGYRSNGLFQTQEEVDNSAVTSSAIKPGDIKYIDISGGEGSMDGLISPEYDRVLLGGSMPRYMYGANIRLDYKGFDFLMVLQGVGKRNARIEPNMARPLQTQNTAVPAFIDGNYWSMYNTPEQNLNAKYPRLSEVTASNNYFMSDYWLFNGSYLRLKNLTLGYNLSELLIEKLSIQSVRIYVSGSDLFSINKYPRGWDPESAATSYPITASFILGTSIKF